MVTSPVYKVIVLCLLFTYSASETCNNYIIRLKAIENGEITAKENVIHVVATVIANKTYQAQFSCREGYKLTGSPSSVCHPNGTWSQPVPKCVEQCANLESINNIKISTQERTINVTVNIKCHPGFQYDGPPYLKCKHGGWVTRDEQRLTGNPKCTEVPKYMSWKVPVIIAGCCFGAICILIIWLSICVWQRRKHGKLVDREVKKNPRKLESLFCVKIWDADRKKRKLIVAEDLESLKTEVCLQFGINGRFVLEEDGTEIETDIALLRCRDKTLMVLGKGEEWQLSRSRQYKNAEESSAFQVFTPDRKKSVMILCYSMAHLCEQISHVFGYVPCYICLETDGTVLQTDEELVAFTGNRLIAIKEGTLWTKPQYDNTVTNSSRENHRFSRSDHKNMFKVWSEDGKKRRNIFANNIVELHYAAASEFGLQTPVEITTLDGNLMSDNILLANHVNDVLIVKEITHSGRLHLRNEPSHDYSVYSA